jgi:hypothetical protein
LQIITREPDTKSLRNHLNFALLKNIKKLKLQFHLGLEQFADLDYLNALNMFQRHVDIELCEHTREAYEIEIRDFILRQDQENYFTKRFSSPAKSQINQDEQESIKALPGRRI